MFEDNGLFTAEGARLEAERVRESGELPEGTTVVPGPYPWGAVNGSVAGYALWYLPWEYLATVALRQIQREINARHSAIRSA